MYDYGNEISEMLADGYDYEDAVEWCKFVCGENITEDNYAKPIN